MPANQTAATGVYGFGAPNGADDDANEILRFSVRRGANINVRVENLGRDETEGDVTFSIQVSPLTISWADTTAAANLTAVADVAIGPREHRDFPIGLRQGTDQMLRFVASGGVQGNVQINGDEHLQIVTI